MLALRGVSAITTEEASGRDLWLVIIHGNLGLAPGHPHGRRHARDSLRERCEPRVIWRWERSAAPSPWIASPDGDVGRKGLNIYAYAIPGLQIAR